MAQTRFLFAELKIAVFINMHNLALMLGRIYLAVYPELAVILAGGFINRRFEFGFFLRRLRFLSGRLLFGLSGFSRGFGRQRNRRLDNCLFAFGQPFV